MIYLENKLHLFRKIVYEKRADENRRRLKQVKQECEEEYREKKKEFEKQKEKAILRRKHLGENQYRQAQAKIRENDKISMLRKEEELIEDLLEGMKERIRKFVQSKDYEKYLRELFRQTVDHLEKGRYRLEILERDQNLWKELLEEIPCGFQFSTVPMEDSSLGGFLVEDEEGSYRIDNTLLEKLEDYRYHMGKLLHDTLRGDGLEKGKN